MTITIKKEQICELVISDQTICIKEIEYVQGVGNYSKFYLKYNLGAVVLPMVFLLQIL